MARQEVEYHPRSRSTRPAARRRPAASRARATPRRAAPGYPSALNSCRYPRQYARAKTAVVNSDAARLDALPRAVASKVERALERARPAHRGRRRATPRADSTRGRAGNARIPPPVIRAGRAATGAGAARARATPRDILRVPHSAANGDDVDAVRRDERARARLRASRARRAARRRRGGARARRGARRRRSTPRVGFERER